MNDFARARDTRGCVDEKFLKTFSKRVDKSKKICYNTYTNKKGMVMRNGKDYQGSQ